MSLLTQFTSESELEEMKKAAFKRIDEEYYNRDSKHYKDNERYSWAVKTINSWACEQLQPKLSEETN